MSPRPSRLALALGATALAAAATATTATTAHAAPAGAYKLVYVHNYQDANALAECRTAGIAACPPAGGTTTGASNSRARLMCSFRGG
ncbi:hypothetical protein ACFQ9X_38300 [Catenulispora yoronensis]